MAGPPSRRGNLLGRFFCHRVHRGFGRRGGIVACSFDRGSFDFGCSFSLRIVGHDIGVGVGDRLVGYRFHRLVGGDFYGVGFGFGRSIVGAAAGGKYERGSGGGGNTELHGILL